MREREGAGEVEEGEGEAERERQRGKGKASIQQQTRSGKGQAAAHCVCHMWQQLRCDILSAVGLHSGAKELKGKSPCSASLAISVVFIAKRAKKKETRRALEETFVASFTSIFINLGRRHTHTSTHYTRTHISVYTNTHTHSHTVL